MLYTRLWRWLNRGSGNGCHWRGRHHRPVWQLPLVLRLLPLEDRTLPSAFTVTNLADAGPGSLRQAILDANAHPGLA